MYILLLWTELGSSGVLDCVLIIDCSSMYKTQEVGLIRKKKTNPNLLSHCRMELSFLVFCHFWCPAGMHCCAVSPERVTGTSPCHGLCGVCLPTTAVPSPGPLQEFPSQGGEVSSCSICHGHAGTVLLRFTCCIYQGTVQSLRWQGQLYCLVSQGRAAPLLLLCWWLWVLLWACSLQERTVLNLHPLLTEDCEPDFGTSPPLATQQVALRQRWILWTLWMTPVPTAGRVEAGLVFIFSLDGVVSVVVWR